MYIYIFNYITIINSTQVMKNKDHKYYQNFKGDFMFKNKLNQEHINTYSQFQSIGTNKIKIC